MRTPHETDNNYSSEYKEVISYYYELESKSQKIKINEWGMTDVGEPLHTIVLSQEGFFDVEAARQYNKTVLLINNGIHPGEPCGVDASMALVRDLIDDKNALVWDDLVIVIIPMYNIGGAKNRNSTTRANQNGPMEYGFRGNKKNFDLNRDFIKCDSKNAQTFNQLFNYWSPDIFVDTHTSNGADYSYTMTLISTMKDKLEKPLHDLLEDKLEPYLYDQMEKKNWGMIPYVYSRDTPDSGIRTFLDNPRYSSGYGSLHHTISFMPETHMLKPFKDRVESTYRFLETMIEFLALHGGEVRSARARSIKLAMTRKECVLNWEIDLSKSQKLLFKGYTAKYKPSKITGLDRLYYDQSEPFEKEIEFNKSYRPAGFIHKPNAYIIPQGYTKVIDRLKWNGVKMTKLNSDIELNVELYSIKKFNTTESAYEGHYLHSEVQTESFNKKWQFFKGDYLVLTDQESINYVIATLEPKAPDSFFAWNFFDGILMRKEYFSPYVFEDLAIEILASDPSLEAKLKAKQKADDEFAKDGQAQLEYIYENSPYYEQTHNIYPIARLHDLGQLK